MDFSSSPDRRAHGSIKWGRFSEDTIPLWVADMDFPAAPCIKEALLEVVEYGNYGYSLPLKELISTVIDRLWRLYNWKVEPSSIVWLPGLVPALNICSKAYTEFRKEIVTSTPIYPPFLLAPKYASKKLHTIELIQEATQYSLNVDSLEKTISNETGLYLLCNPHNPVGKVYSKEELLRIAEICLKTKTVICSDEIHCDLILDEDKQHIPIASLSPEIAEATVTLMSPSKTWNIPGLGFSFAIIPDFKIRKKFLRIMKGIVPYPGALGMAAAHAAYKHGEVWRIDLIRQLKRNRTTLDKFIKEECPSLKYYPAAATYLAWLDFRETGIEKPFEHLLKHKVGLSDGVEFGAPGFLRLNFGCTEETLLAGLKRIKEALANS